MRSGWVLLARLHCAQACGGCCLAARQHRAGLLGQPWQRALIAKSGTIYFVAAPAIFYWPAAQYAYQKRLPNSKIRGFQPVFDLPELPKHSKTAILTGF
jgi:hypothetical protein